MSEDTSDQLTLLMLRWDRPMVQLTIENESYVFELIEQRYVEDVLVYIAYHILDPWGKPSRGYIYLVRGGQEPAMRLLTTVPPQQMPGAVRTARYSRLAIMSPQEFRGEIFDYVSHLQGHLGLELAVTHALQNMDAAGLIDWHMLRPSLIDFMEYSPDIPVAASRRQLLEYENSLPTLKKRCTRALIEICHAMANKADTYDQQEG